MGATGHQITRTGIHFEEGSSDDQTRPYPRRPLLGGVVMGKQKESCASKALGVLAKKMFPQDTDGKKVNDELRDIADGESDGGGSSD